MTALRESGDRAGRPSDAVLAAILLAVAPDDLGGGLIRSAGGPIDDAWISLAVPEILGSPTPVRLPQGVPDAQLAGGVDLAATLVSGRPVNQPGLLERSVGCALLLTSAERWSAEAAARLFGLIDRRRRAERTRGSSGHLVLAVDQGCADDERPPALLCERLAFLVDLAGHRAADMTSPAEVADRLRAARALYPKVTVSDKVLESLVATAIALGIPSARVDRMALAAARAHAAWRGAQLAAEPDATAAARLVLAPRARQMPATDKAPDDPVESGQAVAGSDAPDERDDRDAPHDADADRVLAATLAALPHGLLDHLRAQGQGARKAPTASAGRTGLQRHKARRGRPTGATPGDPRHDGPLDLLATVEAAAPWQAYRRRQAMLGKTSHEGQRRLLIAGTDLRVTRFRHCRPATTIIAVDASGSSALHRLGEAKGAVELLLAECYVRRDKVALISFRGKAAEIVLPPTRSLARAKRVLSGLPGGGATPLASGIDAARQLASLERRSGHSCLMVILTDGRANMSRRGLPGRKLAHIDAESAASLVRAEGLAGLFIDTSPRGSAEASALARLMSAPYVPLPHAEAGAIVDQIQKQSVHT